MHKAFTSIELLIVIAIIAVLAVIAVPNFLEAQTRKMTAQSLARMRATDTALSTYRADHQGALPATISNYNWIDRWGYWQALSTPVAYMSSVPPDPISRAYAQNSNNPILRFSFSPFVLWDVNIAMAIKAGTTAPGIWGPIDPFMTGAGMTNAAFIDNYVLPVCKNGNKSDCAYFLRGWGPGYYLPGGTFTTFYDPTNGTISQGSFFYLH